MALPVKISPDYVVNIMNIQGLDIRNIHGKYERFMSYCPGVIIKVKGFNIGSKITLRSQGYFPWCHLKVFQKLSIKPNIQSMSPTVQRCEFYLSN